ncbi:MAG: CD225/dispanin family protein [Sedimentisphaerales bacterium]|nr:CD225/dispanin family protein [Sedimentisphaerales bacterium]
MFCRKCGAQNADNAYKCVQCGEELQQVTVLPPTTQMKIPNYLVQAILITLCCCLPFGIVSIVYAAQVNSKVQAGDIQGALDASGKAKMWCWIGFALGLVANIIAIGVQLISVIAASRQGY